MSKAIVECKQSKLHLKEVSILPQVFSNLASYKSRVHEDTTLEQSCQMNNEGQATTRLQRGLEISEKEEEGVEDETLKKCETAQTNRY